LFLRIVSYLSHDYFNHLCSNEGKIVPAYVLPHEAEQTLPECVVPFCPVMPINRKFDISWKLDISRNLQ